VYLETHCNIGLKSERYIVDKQTELETENK